MHDWLMASLLRSEVRKLSEEKRNLYQFITEIEDKLAEIVDAVDHYMKILVEYPPYKLAGRHSLACEMVFKMTF